MVVKDLDENPKNIELLKSKPEVLIYAISAAIRSNNLEMVVWLSHKANSYLVGNHLNASIYSAVERCSNLSVVQWVSESPGFDMKELKLSYIASSAVKQYIESALQAASLRPSP